MSLLISPKQLWLITYENPLTQRFGSDFFRSIPEVPGVYWMFSKEGALLYIGKAKNLRKRLCSYRQVKPDRHSRKTVRLIHLVARIEWEKCASEQSALLRENQLLRLHQPPFNVMNTFPEMYYFLAFQEKDSFFCFRLTQECDAEEKERLFGAFKSRRMVRESYGSLLRLLWAVLAEKPAEQPPDSFEYPQSLVRRVPPRSYQIHLKESLPLEEKKIWKSLLRKFLNGTSGDLLVRITENLLSETSIHPFYYHFIQEDLNHLKDFFKYGSSRNCRLRRYHHLRTPYIAQEDIDDLIVTFKKKA